MAHFWLEASGPVSPFAALASEGYSFPARPTPAVDGNGGQGQSHSFCAFFLPSCSGGGMGLAPARGPPGPRSSSRPRGDAVAGPPPPGWAGPAGAIPVMWGPRLRAGRAPPAAQIFIFVDPRLRAGWVPRAPVCDGAPASGQGGPHRRGDWHLTTAHATCKAGLAPALRPSGEKK